MAAGSSNYRAGADPNGWNRYVLQELKDVVDYIALHIYIGNVEDNYYNFLAAPLVAEDGYERKSHPRNYWTAIDG